MSANLTLVVLIGLLGATGVNLLLRRTLTKMLIGTILLGNAVNLLILAAGGPSGAPPIVGAAEEGRAADPLAQAMILTAIVISLGVAAFVLALAYRSYRLQTDEDVDDDAEDEIVALRAEIEDSEPDDQPARVDVGDTEGQLRT
ncbi:MAG: Na(+)/H(+) antiporter subunit C [Segniliparus sp.]|uniref:Na(+)/H(+) antiporter subunit C n=1 Tax=Segniliparus sp. TaxID=2804064 RepID=UPI003F358CB9